MQPVQYLQGFSGLCWLAVALLITPGIVRSWTQDATRANARDARISLFAWMQVGFIVRWLVWPDSVGAMAVPELITWATLYAMSAVIAGWVLADLIPTRKA